MRIMFAAVNHDYCLGSRSGSEVERKGPPTQLQHCALIKLGIAAALMMDLNPSTVGNKDWEREMKTTRLAYDGSEGAVAEAVTARQIGISLPAPGVAGSVDILPLVSAGTRELLLHPERVRLDDEEVNKTWSRPRFFARGRDEELKVKQLLYERGLVSAEDPSGGKGTTLACG